ncbi:hypothetical protein MLF63_07835, partial [Escherichia coli]|nr:hypothetical protein [Escherichia coli]MCN8232785.1 hypothetical protein [Escherichia coli]
RTRRPDKTRQRCIRHCAPIAGCGVNALSGHEQHRLWAVLCFLRQAFFRQTGNVISACFSIY